MNSSIPKGTSRSPGTFKLSSGRLLRTTPIFDMYWRFACERQAIFFKRIEGAKPPWTDDPILRAFRFTNVYRATDRVSQFLIRHVIYDGKRSPEEIFFRTMLFKLFNRIETWNLLRVRLGQISWKTFDLERYNSILGKAMRDGQRIYSSAYIMPCPAFGGRKKHTNHLALLAHMMKAGAPHKIEGARSFQEVFATLRSFPSIGDFLAFQFAVDLNYSELTHFSEMDFVVAGPGARSGLRKAFLDNGDLSDEDLIAEVTKAAEREFKERGLRFQNLWGRPLQLIDCQNLFCEIDKYSRVAYPQALGSGRKRIKRKYSAPSPTGEALPQWYPPKWSLQVPAMTVSLKTQ